MDVINSDCNSLGSQVIYLKLFNDPLLLQLAMEFLKNISRVPYMNIFLAGCFELPKDWINVQADLPADYGDPVTLSCREKLFLIGDKVVTCNPTFSIQNTPKCLSKSKLQRLHGPTLSLNK